VFLQDLQEVLRQDKKLLYSDSAPDRVGVTAAKAKEVVRKTLNKRKNRFQQPVNNNRSDSASTADISSLPQANNDAPGVQFCRAVGAAPQWPHRGAAPRGPHQQLGNIRARIKI
jgi:hypothetical protein